MKQFLIWFSFSCDLCWDTLMMNFFFKLGSFGFDASTSYGFSNFSLSLCWFRWANKHKNRANLWWIIASSSKLSMFLSTHSVGKHCGNFSVVAKMGVLMVGGSCKCMTFQKRGIFWKLVLVYFSGWEEKHSTVRHILACQEIMYRLLFRTFHIGPKVVQLFAQSVCYLMGYFRKLSKIWENSRERVLRDCSDARTLIWFCWEKCWRKIETRENLNS